MVKSRSGIIRMAVGPAKGRLVTLIDEATSNILKSAIPADTANCTKQLDDIQEYEGKIKSAIQTLCEKDEQWRDLIFGLDDDDEVANEETLYSAAALKDGDGYLATIERGKELVCTLQRRQTELKRKLEQIQPQQPPQQPSQPTQSMNPTTTAKLPKLTLPIFGGNHLDWPRFWAIFKTNIHNRNLSGTEKLAYLTGQLTGTAIGCIDGLSVTDANYDVAVNVLRERYERTPTQLVGTLYSQLKRLPKATRNVASMLQTYDACEKIFRQLDDAGENVAANRSLVLEVLSKYPAEVIKDLLEKKDVGVSSSLEELRSGLHQFIKQSESLEEVMSHLDPFEAKSSSVKTRGSMEKTDSTTTSTDYRVQKQTSALAAAASGGAGGRSSSGAMASKPSNPCYFCNEHHFNSGCQQYPTFELRINRLKALLRCIRCMSSTHAEAACTVVGTRLRCFFCKTTGDHASPLCPKQFGASTTSKEAKGTSAMLSATTTPPQGLPTNTSNVMLNASENSLLLTARTMGVNNESGRMQSIRILFDTGSHRSYVTEKCAQTLALRCLSDECLRVAVFGTSRTLSVSSQQVTLAIQQRNGFLKSIQAHTTPVITNCPIMPAVLPVQDAEMIRTHDHTLADDFGPGDGGIDVLIGSDYFWEFVSGARIATPSGLYIIPSTLGALIGGRLVDEDGTGSNQHSSLLCLTETFSQVPNESGLLATQCHFPSAYPDVDEFWNLEKIGITDNPQTNDDDEALRQFNESVYLAEGRYHVKWPWKHNSTMLPANYELAMGRFKSLAKRLRASDDTDIAKAYQSVIADQLQKGVIERVTDDMVAEGSAKKYPIHYLPHHPVVKPSSTTTKVRIVYDASARVRKDSPSLNECLYRGPVLLPDLCSILLRFRLNTIAVVADIEKAFLQLCLQPSERDVTRFVWFEDPTVLHVDNNIVVYRFKRVPFGVISSPFLLNGTIVVHLKTIDNWIARNIRFNIYVDNVLSGVQTIESAKQFYTGAKDIFAEASMNLQEWCSNSDELMAFIPPTDQVKDRDCKVLGMQWDSKEDTLRIRRVAELCGDTKRQVLQSLASIYDPLGLFQPVLLQAKVFLQDLWNDKLGWDDKIASETRQRWDEIRNNIMPLENIRIPRNPCGMNVNGQSTIVTFCDASMASYSAAVYLRTLVSGQWTCNLVYSKSRLAPRQRSSTTITLPRLELLGVLIGTRASTFVRDSLLLTSAISIYLFTDSRCVLHWLNSSKPLSVFVENRVKEIKQLNDAEFMYVSTNDNPADLGTRGKTAVELQASDLWWKGPSWLTEPVDGWPNRDDEIQAMLPCSAAISDEFRKSPPPIFHTMLAGEGGPISLLGIDPTRYSSLRKLLRVSAWCLKFLKLWFLANAVDSFERLPQAIYSIFDKVSTETHITMGEIKNVKYMWVRSIQNTDYSDVCSALSNNKHHTLVKQLGLAIDDEGLIRCGGRLQNADLSPDAINPILLPRKNHVTTLIIREVHEQLFHSGISHTLSQLRRLFWITQGRAAVRKVRSGCVLCKKYNGAPFALPKMPPWPKERLGRSSPFQFTGLDYLGPITVKVGSEVRKMWVCLFTCLAVRSIHLEWISDCSAKEFLQCVIRFVSRRGTPSQIISDNAPQFRVTKTVFERIWSRVLGDDLVRSYASGAGIDWRFTTELAPWQGGFYERLVGIVKSTMRSAVGRRLLGWEEFITVCTEVEAIVNTRPITYVYGELQSGVALRPIDFITDLPVGIPTTDGGTATRDLGDAGKNLVRIWKQKERRLNSVWEFWYNEYLLSLRERYQSKHKGRRGELDIAPNVGEVVLVKETDQPRGAWKLATVERLIPSRDNLTRSAEVKLCNGVVIRRAINFLYPLEIDQTLSTDENNNETNVITDHDNDFEGFTANEVEESVDRVNRMQIARNNINCNLNALAVKLDF